MSFIRVSLLLTFPTRTMCFTSKSSRQCDSRLLNCHFSFLHHLLQYWPLGGGGGADVMHFTSPIASPSLGAEHYCMPQRVAEGCIKACSCHCVFLCYETVHSVGYLLSSGQTHFLRHHIIPCKWKQCLLPTWWLQNIRLRGKAWCKQLIGSYVDRPRFH